MIKISVPNDDHVALRAMAKALEEIAVARGAPAHNVTQHYNFEVSDEVLKDAQLDTNALRAKLLKEMHLKSQIDNTSQQVESLSLEKLQNLNPKTPAPAEFPEQWKEAATKVISEAVEQGAFTDSTGTPWDDRIHSASKALNADGTWRLRRKPKDMDEVEWLAHVGTVRDELSFPADREQENKHVKVVEEETFAQIQELIKEPAAPTNDLKELFARNEPTDTPEGDDFHTDAGVVTEQQVASFPPPPPVPVSAVQAALEKGMERYGDAMSKLAENDGAPSLTFPQVMAFLTERHGRITSAQVDQIIADMGLEKITDLNTQPEHTGPFIARVKALLGE